MTDESTFRVDVERTEGFEFRVRFDLDQVPELRMDEPEPLGAGRGPNAGRVLAAAVGNCLSASLLFCLQKSRLEPERIATRAEGRLTRNDEGHLRIGSLDVRIDVDGFDDARTRRVERCAQIFEDFCVVTASVRQGIPIDVSVHADGEPVVSSRESADDG